MAKKKSLGKFLMQKSVIRGLVTLASVFSAGKIIRFIDRHFRKEKKRDSVARFMVISAWIAGTAVAFLAGVHLLLKYVRRLRGGYLTDLFDRDKFDIADPEEAVKMEAQLRRDLAASDVYTVSPLQPDRHSAVPRDEDATEDNLG